MDLKQLEQEAAADVRKHYGRLKIVPLIVAYQLWVVAIYQSSGWLSAVAASMVTGCWIIGRPRGFLRNVALVIVLGIVVPVILAPSGVAK